MLTDMGSSLARCQGHSGVLTVHMGMPGPDEYNLTHATHVPKKLSTLARDILGMEIQVEGRPHSPVEDTVAALDLYK
jgi:hypothetical protein